MISGMRKAPPISISSPRETIASRPFASVLSTSSTAAALLLTIGCVLGPGEFAQQPAQHVVTLAAPATVEVEFERHRIAHCRDGGGDGFLGDQRAAEIGVQHGAGEVVDRSEARGGVRFQAGEGGGRRLLGTDHVAPAGARRGERGPHRVDDRVPSEPLDRERSGLRAQHLIDRGQPAQIGSHDRRHGGFGHSASASFWSMILSESRRPLFGIMVSMPSLTGLRHTGAAGHTAPNDQRGTECD